MDNPHFKSHPTQDVQAAEKLLRPGEHWPNRETYLAERGKAGRIRINPGDCPWNLWITLNLVLKWRSKISKCSHSHNMMIKKRASGACYPRPCPPQGERESCEQRGPRCGFSSPKGWNGPRTTEITLRTPNMGDLGSLSCDTCDA